MTMRLAFIVTEFPKTTETFILRDLVEFRRRGHDVRIYHMTSFRRNEVVHGFARETLEWARSRPFLLGWSVLGALGRAVARRPRELARIAATLIRELWREPGWLAKSLFIVPKCLAFAEDIREWPACHVHAEFATHPATCAWIVGRLTGVPYSVSCRAHDIFLTQRMLDVKLGEASFVRTISQYNRRFLREHVSGLDGREVAVIHSSVPVEDIPPLPQPDDDGEFRIRYLGSLESRKGIDVLLRSLAAVAGDLGRWNCRIVGKGPEERGLKRLRDELGLAGRVSFDGPLPFERISRVYEEAHVVAVPSVVGPGGRTEGIPNVIMEALAHQRPVIATSVSGVPELIEEGATGLLVPPGDAERLADAIKWVRANPREAYRLAVNGRGRVLAEYNLSVNAGSQLELFERHSAPGTDDGVVKTASEV
jgi:colanic acid/amylovoran biosynthesis glycosyltransferase